MRRPAGGAHIVELHKIVVVVQSVVTVAVVGRYLCFALQISALTLDYVNTISLNGCQAKICETAVFWGCAAPVELMPYRGLSGASRAVWVRFWRLWRVRTARLTAQRSIQCRQRHCGSAARVWDGRETGLEQIPRRNLKRYRRAAPMPKMIFPLPSCSLSSRGEGKELKVLNLTFHALSEENYNRRCAGKSNRQIQ